MLKFMFINNNNRTIDFVVKYPPLVNNLIFLWFFYMFYLENNIPTDDILSFKIQLTSETEVKLAKSNFNLLKLF